MRKETTVDELKPIWKFQRKGVEEGRIQYNKEKGGCCPRFVQHFKQKVKTNLFARTFLLSEGKVAWESLLSEAKSLADQVQLLVP